MIKANERQVAGSHYRKPIQHWDYVIGNKHSYLGGQASKYISRWKDKNGVMDLDKADHFLEKMIDAHHNPPAPVLPEIYAEAQELDENQKLIVSLVDIYEQTHDVSVLGIARAALAMYREQHTSSQNGAS